MLEYQALIDSLTVRWHELQRQFLEFQNKEALASKAAGGRSGSSSAADDAVEPINATASGSSNSSNIMGGPDFVTRVNKLREAIDRKSVV